MSGCSGFFRTAIAVGAEEAIDISVGVVVADGHVRWTVSYTDYASFNIAGRLLAGRSSATERIERDEWP